MSDRRVGVLLDAWTAGDKGRLRYFRNLLITLKSTTYDVT